MGLPKGRTNNPNGRRKGSRNKIQRDAQLTVDEIAEYLTDKGKGLKECAEENPKWFFETFFKLRIPKAIEISHDGELTVKWQS